MMYIFDVDGVITDPYTKTPNNQIIQTIAEELEKNNPVGIMSGRALAWIETHIITKIQKYLVHQASLQTLFVSGEKGGEWMEFVHEKPEKHTKGALPLPEKVIKKIKQYVSSIDGIFFDPDKHTMISLEIVGGEKKGQISRQKEALKKVHVWLQNELQAFLPDIYLEECEISIDILSKQMSKKVAVHELLEFLKEKHVSPDVFIMFGDGYSDALVPEELYRKGKASKLVYVGLQALPVQYPFAVIQPKELFDEGVLEVLHSLGSLLR